MTPDASVESSNPEQAERSAARGVRVRRIKFCVVATADMTIQSLCRGRLEYFSEHGFDVTVVCAPTPLAAEIEARGVRLFTAPLRRAITPMADVRSVVRLWRFFRREAFDLIEVSTPKAALLGAVAARLAGARCVVHLLRGLAYHGQSTIQRRLLMWSQRCPCRLAHYVVGVSHSLREQADADGVCPGDRMIVLGEGSSNGVDLEHFSPRLRAGRDEVRRRWNLPTEAVVIGFVGRMTGDKGLVELVDAMEMLVDRGAPLALLLVGDYEERDRPPRRTLDAISAHGWIRHVGWQSDPAPFFGAMDVLALPSHREGFNNVLLHASAAGLPVVTTTAVGCRDAVRDGVTGWCVPPGDSKALAAALGKLLEAPEMRERMGAEGREWVAQHFAQERVWAMQEALFRDVVGA